MKLVPKFPELSVKNIYDDAIGEPLLSQYLTTLEQNSGRLPERHFFFGVIATLKPDYLGNVIDIAYQQRYSTDQKE